MTTQTLDAPAKTPPIHVYHQHEQFVWSEETFDIARLLRDIQAGKIRPKLTSWGRAAIEGYAMQVLALQKGDSVEQAQKRMSLIMRVDVKAAMALPDAAMEQPLVVLWPRKGMGIMQLEENGGLDYVLADGQHRVARAFLEGRDSLPVFQLSKAQSRKYRVD